MKQSSKEPANQRLLQKGGKGTDYWNERGGLIVELRISLHAEIEIERC